MMSVLLFITATASAFAAFFTAYSEYKTAQRHKENTEKLIETNGRLGEYRLEINSRMDEFIKVVKQASFAAGQADARKDAAEMSVRQAAKVIEAAADRVASPDKPTEP